jgi:hypothetical protein
VLSLVPNHDHSVGEEHRFLVGKSGMQFIFLTCKNERTVSDMDVFSIRSATRKGANDIHIPYDLLKWPF